jgi:rare lipoprotein A
MSLRTPSRIEHIRNYFAQWNKLAQRELNIQELRQYSRSAKQGVSLQTMNSTLGTKALKATDLLAKALWFVLDRLIRLLLAILKAASGPARRILQTLLRTRPLGRIAKSAFGREITDRANSPALRCLWLESVDFTIWLRKLMNSSIAARRVMLLLFALLILRMNLADGPVQPKGEWKPLGHCIASYYEKGFLGKPTANGEIFSPFKLTAAHRTLPFNTWLLVRNLNNGRSVVVRINDRGPYVEGRDLDLSKAAASALGILVSGLAPVEIKILKQKSVLEP